MATIHGGGGCQHVPDGEVCWQCSYYNAMRMLKTHAPVEPETFTPETFTPRQVQLAIEEWLEYGEASFSGQFLERGHRGYFSRGGWAARCLRWHLEQLRKDNP